MSRTAGLVLALSLLVAACGTGGEASDDADSDTTSTTSTSTTTTTTATTTTTDPCAEEPFSIDERGSTRLVPGCRYRTEEFLLFPVEFVVEEDGWLGFDMDDRRLVFLGIDWDGDGGADADVAILAWAPDGLGSEQLTTETLLASLEDIEGISIVSDPLAEDVAGGNAATVDIEAGEDPFVTGFTPCTTNGLDFSSDGPGFQLITIAGSGKGDIGFPACGRTRVWIVDKADQPLLVLAAPSDRDRFDEFMPTVEAFLRDSVMFGDPDG